MERKFMDVFAKLDLTGNFEPALLHAIVENVCYFTSVKGLEVRLQLTSPATPDGVVLLEDALSVKMDMLNSVKIVPIYEPEPQPIVRDVAYKSPAETPRRNGNGNDNGYSRQSSKKVSTISGETRPLKSDFFENDEVIVVGRIFKSEAREVRKGTMYIYTIEITDDESSITLKHFVSKDKVAEQEHLLKVGAVIKVAGRVENDKFSGEITIIINKIASGEMTEEIRMDNADVKRVELHLHTNMSALDGMTPVKEIIARAAKWGHKAVAITDHGVVQAYPDAMAAAEKHGIKVIYGMEAYLVDDLDVSIASRPKNAKLSDDFVVFDIETTGLNREHCTIIEIGAVRMRNGVIGEVFHAFVDPEQDLPLEIIKLTNITDDMLVGRPKITEVLPKFLDFVGDAVLVAHNADFDMGFVEHIGRQLGHIVDNPYLCTLQLSRALFPNLPRHGLAAMAKHHEIVQESHHRASDDANVLAQIFSQQIEILKQRGIDTLDMINLRYSKEIDVKTLRPKHATLLVKNQIGMRNLYELVSKSHLEHYNRYPRIPKSELIALREGLLVGTACEQGALYSAVKENRPQEAIEEIAHFYDYFEIQPIGNNEFLVRQGEVESVEVLQNINKKIVEYAQTYNKPIIAACDVHFMDPNDSFYREIIQTGQGFKDAKEQAPLYFRTTDEMLAEFAYLGEEKAYELVVTNTNVMADSIDDGIRPIPKGTYPPIIEGSDKELEEMVWAKARSMYGEQLPQIVHDRISKELGSIIKNGFAVMYIIAQKLIAKSMQDGYLVGSRGSIGSSLVATMADITEVNPLSPHYYCKACKYSDFDSDIVKQYAGAHGCDMPDANCPKCGELFIKEGHSIPFETFLGFDGDKEPDIDLNFSGEYQATAHQYAEELLGEGYVFKAGTISTVANKTAFGYVKKYLEQHNRVERNAHINRLAVGCEGIKRTTGQHPGGLMVVPKGRSIYEFTPIQRPANDAKSDVITTHFDYHSIHENLLKLDLLGHDVPTILKLLHDFTGVDPLTIDLGDKGALSLFRSPEKLGISERETGLKTGSLGLPEFGTDFVRGMLTETGPTSFADLVRISGLSHGTNVWLNNGQELIREKKLTLKEIISTRDDIMLYLISKGLTEKDAFNITEKVRKGKGVTEDEEKLMLSHRVPQWYVDSCRKIAYMFPKGHAVAYVMQAVRFAYYKIHHPMAFYAAAFSVKSDEFSHAMMCKGRDVAKGHMYRINGLGKDATQKEQKSLGLLEVVLEMYARGLNFAPLDLYAASADKFIITENGLMPPLCSVEGLGATVAQKIVEARAQGEFYSIDDLKTRTNINKTVVQLLKDNGVLDGMPETEQLTLF
ncbi:MAG: PolC-type DNA polymerase III [Defluviitaleaceae bacterium]|nr:PolC-type DNA polymerase III [Defluviitaleaceae bacterium]